MVTEIHINNLADINRAADAFLPLLENNRIFAFYGGMGAGKTTFISALCSKLGVEDTTGSPTFAIVNEYSLTPSSTMPYSSIYHFDFYRIKSLAEVYDIGYEDYFYSGNPCFIEWPELIEPLLPEETVAVHISVNPDQSRTLKIQSL